MSGASVGVSDSMSKIILEKGSPKATIGMRGTAGEGGFPSRSHVTDATVASHVRMKSGPIEVLLDPFTCLSHTQVTCKVVLMG